MAQLTVTVCIDGVAVGTAVEDILAMDGDSARDPMPTVNLEVEKALADWYARVGQIRIATLGFYDPPDPEEVALTRARWTRRYEQRESMETPPL